MIYLQSTRHPTVQRLERVRKRKHTSTLLLLGHHMVKEYSGSRVRTFFSTREEWLTDFNSFTPEESILLSDPAWKRISGYESTNAVGIEIDIPHLAFPTPSQRVLCLDRVRDPSNLGTLIRTSKALGWDGLFLIRGCASPFNDKALRASQGTFMPFVFGDYEELFQFSKTHHLRIYCADASGVSWDRAEHPSEQGILLILGEEGNGISPILRDSCYNISIPMKNDVDSLNVGVAGGILMYLLSSSSDSG